MIDIPLVDAHLHVWDIDRLNYPWLAAFPSINRTYLLPDYDQSLDGQEVEAMIFVQCECQPEQFMEELKWVQHLADLDSRLQGIVPWAPIEQGGKVAPFLEQMVQDPRIKGVRRILQGEAVDFCIRSSFIQGVKLLGEYGLHFELTIDPAQFRNVIRLVDQCPETRFILDHIGNPNISDGQLQPWSDGLKAFADSGPHFCKFSNLVCNADLQNWQANDLRPFADHVLETFTPERLVWASDWPHVLRASSWSRWLETADILTSHLSGKERQLIFRENAIDFYRLDNFSAS